MDKFYCRLVCFLISTSFLSSYAKDVFEEFGTLRRGKSNHIANSSFLQELPLVVEDGARADDKMESYLQRQRRAEQLENKNCDFCMSVVTKVQSMLRTKTPVEIIVTEAIRMCIQFSIGNEHVCNLIVPQFQDVAFYVIGNMSLTTDQACGIVIGDSCGTPYFPGEMWNITLPNTPKPPPQPPLPPKPQSPTLRFLHLTDIHLDMKYAVGAAVPCDEHICCRSDENATHSQDQSSASDSFKAGKYGDYRKCDLPNTTLDFLFSHLNSIQDQFDYVIMTGDIAAHDVYSQTRAEQLSHIIALDKLFSRYLPSKPVYYSVGNHDGWPDNTFPPYTPVPYLSPDSHPVHLYLTCPQILTCTPVPYLSPDSHLILTLYTCTLPVPSFPPPGIPGHDFEWMYGAMAEAWGKWLPQSSLETIVRCGGYSFSPYPGFRIISINNNYCNKGNWWLLLNATDPCNVLEWLVQELQSAEVKGEKVHMLMHLPPGNSVCMKAWSWNYYRIVNRYENTIVNQFYGHNHTDWYEMFYDDVTFQRPLGVGFVAPSVTPYSYNNPNYRIYTMDGTYNGSSWAVLDYSNFYLNLTEANLYNTPTWRFEYSPKQAYNMTGLYAADWDQLLQRMEKDDTLFQLFYTYNRNLYPETPCHGNCKADIFCNLIEGRSYDPDLCPKHFNLKNVS
ncbi:sphingomyelin phosphodiesterase-like [Physella acuta]|uniref:sphingomyelin phosphodiesterase-like n=1 Tax=Physella acuta TaxID=109671 RepID=UPI0027DDC2A9|nr:sphingomyelin phosphodiesterase-like [Physella acuta]